MSDGGLLAPVTQKQRSEMEMRQLRASEVAVAQGTEAQTATMLGVLRTTQNRAESSSMAALEQQKLAGDLDAYANRLSIQGGMMMSNSEPKQRNLAAEVNANRAEVIAC